MTVVVPCDGCGGTGLITSAGFAVVCVPCPKCCGKGYRTNTEYKPPEVPRKPQGMAPWVQLELPV